MGQEKEVDGRGYDDLAIGSRRERGSVSFFFFFFCSKLECVYCFLISRVIIISGYLRVPGEQNSFSPNRRARR
jgi:hypothetical protein